MMNKLMSLNGFLIVVFSLIFSCNKPKENFKNELKILIRTNNNCTNIITLNKESIGKLYRGIGNHFKENFIELKGVDEEFSFSIKLEEDITYINKMIDSISIKETFKGGFLNDAPHYELYINSIKKIDTYGTEPNVIHDILKKIWKNLPREINYYCQ